MEYITKINEKGQIAVDDTLLVKGELCTAGSKMLYNFKPLFSAECVSRLEEKGYLVSGKTNVGEFGLGFLSENSYFGASKSNGKLVSASAELVARGEVKGALGVDLNGSTRRGACISGVKNIKATYGVISRYGVIACACSGETVSITAKDTDGLIEILSSVAGYDKKDGTSLNKEYNFKADGEVKRVAVISELKNESLDCVIEKLSKMGVVVEEVSIKEIEEIATAWQILMSAETCNNLSRYDGVKYGYRTENYTDIDDLYVNTRTEGLGLLTKENIVYGSYVLSKSKYLDCYDKSLKIRGIAKKIAKEIFEKYDLILTPVYSGKEYTEEDFKENHFEKVFNESKYTAFASITGLPAIVSDGVQFIGDYFSENLLFSLTKSLEK